MPLTPRAQCGAAADPLLFHRKNLGRRCAKGVPVLLRQYLKLGARFFSFNVDTAFGDAIDALMYVDLAQTDILDRYMGKEAATNFFAHHRRLASHAVPVMARCLSQTTIVDELHRCGLLHRSKLGM
jgi:hypothetical protein